MIDFETKQHISDARVINTATAYMRSSDYRQDCVVDVLECHDKSDLAFLIEKLVFGGPSAQAEAHRELVNMVESAAYAFARSQQ